MRELEETIKALSVLPPTSQPPPPAPSAPSAHAEDAQQGVPTSPGGLGAEDPTPEDAIMEVSLALMSFLFVFLCASTFVLLCSLLDAEYGLPRLGQAQASSSGDRPLVQ